MDAGADHELEKAGFPTAVERAALAAAVDAIAAADRVIAHAHAGRQVALAIAGGIAHAQHERQVASGASSNSWAHRAVAEEIAAATNISGRAAERQMNAAAVLLSRFPRVQERMAVGLLSPAHAQAIVAAGDTLGDDRAALARFEQAVLDKLAEQPMTAATLRTVARRIAETIHPVPLDERHASAHQRRRVAFEADEDGMGWLTAYIPSVMGAAIIDRLDQMARQVRSARHSGGPELYADDTRTLAHLRTDVMCDLLLAAPPMADPGIARGGLGAIRGTVHITIPVKSPGGAAAEPAHLAGYGPLPLDVARVVMAGARTWSRLFVDADTSVLLTADQRFPTAAQRRFVFARDEHCRFPGCRAPIVDLDHTIAYSEGGATNVANLEGLCESHHTLEQATAWRVEQLSGGRLRWTSPLGRAYIDIPEPVLRRTPRFIHDGDPPPG
ncbi:DUF222 domain-containing protein [Microbacterium sp. NPDC055683]